MLFDVVREAVERWPQPPDPIRGRSMADLLKAATVNLERKPHPRSILRRLLQKVGGHSGSGSVRRIDYGSSPVTSPVPAIDRRTTVLQSLGVRPMLYAGKTRRRQSTRSGEKVHVYLDVSGSMAGLEGAIYGAILDCRAWVHPRVHLFSTEVKDISHAAVRKGVKHSTGGTDIDCVARHMHKHRVRRACIITDGWVGKPAGSVLATLTKARLGVAFAGENTHLDDLQGLARYTAHLPV